jgi:hypothetical protein
MQTKTDAARRRKGNMKYKQPTTSAIGQMTSSETNEVGLRRQAAFLDNGSYDERQLLSAADELALLRDDRDRLREALRPFAEVDIEDFADKDDLRPVWGRNATLLLLGDFRRAHDALNPTKPNER